MNVELRDEARADLVEGAVFYGEQSDGLDEYFLKCLREDIEKLESSGGIHEQYRGFHRSLSEHFPYAIYYLISEELVDVVAILDCRRDPATINSRLGRTKP
jgi:plasmid stabilization system protein ParE